MRLIVIEGDDLLRLSLLEMLAERTTFELVGDCDDAAEGIELTKRLGPDVVIVGGLAGSLGPADVIRQIKASTPSLLVLCVGETARRAPGELVEAGASGFLDRDHPESLLSRLFPLVAPGTGNLGPPGTF